MSRSESAIEGVGPSIETFWVAGAFGILATAVGAILPILIGVWQRQAGLGVDQAGFIAATELFSQVAGTVLFLWASRLQPLRTIAAVGLGVMVAGNIATAVSTHLSSLIAARIIGGTGGGVLRALCMLCLAKAARPGRAFSLYAGAQVGLAALTTALIPHFIEAQGARAPFVVMTLASALAFALCPLLPRSPPPEPVNHHREFAPLPMGSLLAIGALFIFFLGQGALWTYLEPLGAYRSIPAGGVTQALSLLNFAGLAGALGVGALAHRSSPRLALCVLLGTEVLSIAALFAVHSSAGFVVAACLFYFSWCASFPFQFTVISQSDRSGRSCAIVPAADGLGLAAGAALAAAVLPAFGMGSAGWLCGAASFVGITLYIVSATLSERSSSKPPSDATFAALEG